MRPGGARVLSLRFAGDLALDVLIAVAWTLGAAWWGSVPVAWRSPHLVDPGPGRGWEDRFLGGLLATAVRTTSGRRAEHPASTALTI